jgi:hypothetical protein
MSTDQAMQAQAVYEEELLAKSNVVGVGVGLKESNGEFTGETAVVVLVQEKRPVTALAADDLIPRELEGIRTDVMEVGYVRALQSQNPRGRFRPTIPAGVSIGHYKVTAGTLGAIVIDRRTGEKLLLSNNHVLANSNDAVIGDPILQPGSIDGGVTPGDVVARLERFIRLRYEGETVEEPKPDPKPNPDPQPPSGSCDALEVVVLLTNLVASLLGSEKRVAAASTTTSASAFNASPAPVAMSASTISAQAPDNLVDCAVARPLDPNAFSSDILGIGSVSGTKPATLGMQIKKHGRTTGFTEAMITLINGTISVAYGPGQARFTNQIIAQAMSQGGDSGSLVVDSLDNKAVGLLFAGSNLATIINPIEAVLNALEVNI